MYLDMGNMMSYNKGHGCEQPYVTCTLIPSCRSPQRAAKYRTQGERQRKAMEKFPRIRTE